MQKLSQGRSIQVGFSHHCQVVNILLIFIPFNLEKDLGFLRIGSLNVRVKKTTEAFSNFLGVGNTARMSQMIHMRASAPQSAFEKFELKSWGSADTIPQVKYFSGVLSISCIFGKIL